MDYWKKDSSDLPASSILTSSSNDFYVQSLKINSLSSAENITDDFYGGVWEGKINISEEGEYIFYFDLVGSINFKIDNSVILETITNSTSREVSAKVYLDKGLHNINSIYNIDLNEDTKSFWEGPTFSKRILNQSSLIKDNFYSDIYTNSNKEINAKSAFSPQSVSSNISIRKTTSGRLHKKANLVGSRA